MIRSTASALRMATGFALVAALVVLFISLAAATASAAPKDDVGGGSGDPGVVVDDSTETPRPELEPEVPPVAIPSVSPEPETTPDPSDVTGPLDGGVLDPAVPTASSDLHLTFEVCNPPVADQIANRWCGPGTSGPEAYVLGTNGTPYTTYYDGPYPATLLDIPAGPYALTNGPTEASTYLTTICRVEDGAGNLLETLTGPFGYLEMTIGNGLAYRCTVYQLPDVAVSDTVQRTDGPAELIVKDFVCPPGTDPALNFFGLIGRCQQVESGTPYEVTNPAGAYESKETQGDGNVTFDVYGGISWTVTRVQNNSPYLPPVLFCNVRDDLLQEPDRYAPFMTYASGPEGAVLPLEQGMTWFCGAYSIPTDVGDGQDSAQVSVTSRACPEGTLAPTAALCAETLAGVTVHLIFAGETIVATRQTDASGVVAFAAPEHLQVFGLAEEVPAGYRLASTASCSVDGAPPTDLVVDQVGIVDLGTLTGGDSVACDWFNFLDPGAPAAPAADLDIADAGDLDPAPVDATAGDAGGVPTDEVGDGQDEPGIDVGEDAVTDETPESGGIVPLEEDE